MMQLDQPETSAQVLRRNGRSFHWAGRFLNGDQFASAASLYSLCRRIDDLADEAVTASQRASAGEQLHELDRALAEGRPPAEALHPLYQQACTLLVEEPMAVEALRDLIATVQQDLDAVLMADDAELLQYCYGVAGTVGVMMGCLLGARPRASALPHAIDLGIAMQMTNIARDVLEDAHLGRVYLPAQGAAGVIDPASLVAADPQYRHQAWLGVRELLWWAEAYYASAWQGLRYLPPRPRLAIAVAASLYREIGRQILRRGEGVYWQQRSVVSPLRKIQVSVTAATRLLMAPTRNAAGVHDGLLHQGLTTCLDACRQCSDTVRDSGPRAVSDYGE